MEKITLTGADLTIEQLVAIANGAAQVEISESAKRRLEAARQLVFDLVDVDYPIYGFNVGVGWNKDKKIFKEYFEKYNADMIRAHCIGVPPYASDANVRAAMLARLNTMLVGCSGLSPSIPEMYAEMLNHGIHPLVPERGSVGQGDIGLLSHIGLAVIGESEVRFGGETMLAREAFERVGLKPLALGPKDGLAIFSSNAMGAGPGAIVLHELAAFLDIAGLVYAASLEGLDGNVAPLDDRNHARRGYWGQRSEARRGRAYLAGSYLHEPNPERPLQDPLCYRSFAQIHGAAREMLAYTWERLEIQLNSTDDNPCVLIEDREIVSSANFEPLNWVLGLEGLAIALSHVSKAASLRIVRLANPVFTRLPRFLSPADEVLCYQTVQKTFAALDAEIRHLCNPCSMDGMSLAGDMEDTSTNSPYVVQNLARIVDDLRYIFAVELMHAVQGMDLRAGKGSKEGKKFGRATTRLLDEVRARVPFYETDRNITLDIVALREMFVDGSLLAIARSVETEDVSE